MLTLLAALVFLPALGQNHNWSSREVRHAEIMREMAETGEFVVPHRLGKAYINKPPVMHAIRALFMRAFDEPNMFLAHPL